MYAGNGPGGLTGSRLLPIDVSPYDWIVGVSDVHLKAHPDLIVRSKATGELILIEGRNKSFKTPVSLGGDWRGQQ